MNDLEKNNVETILNPEKLFSKESLMEMKAGD